MATWPTITVEIAFSTSPGEDVLIFDDTERGVFDQGAFAEADYWTNVTAYLDGDPGTTAIEIVRGRDNPQDGYPPGRMTLRLTNGDGRFDRNNLDGPYVAAGISQILPGIRVRCTAELNGTTYTLFQGYIEKWVPLPSRTDPLVVLEAVDAFDILAAFDPFEQSPSGGGEDAGDRIDRILDNIDWPVGDRDLDAGDRDLQATTLAQNVLTEIRLTADSDFGAVFITRDGKIRFQHGLGIFNDTRSRDVQATFGPGELPYVALTPANDTTRVRNIVSAARVGGSEIEEQDDESIARYLPRRWKRTDLILQDDADVQLWVDAMLYISKDAPYRYDEVVIDPLTGADDTEVDDLWEAVLDRELRDRIAVIEQVTYDDGDEFTVETTAEVFVERIEYRFANPRSCTVNFSLSDAAPFTGFIFDDTERGVFDQDAFAIL